MSNDIFGVPQQGYDSILGGGLELDAMANPTVEGPSQGAFQMITLHDGTMLFMTDDIYLSLLSQLSALNDPNKIIVVEPSPASQLLAPYAVASRLEWCDNTGGLLQVRARSP